jgi:hypothetical protein
MNTSMSFNPVNGTNKGGRISHVFRDHDLKKKRVSNELESGSMGAIILQPYKPKEPVLKIGTSKISTKLATYKKRYSVALEKGDEKTAARNLVKVQELELELSGTQKARRGREAELVEASWTITKFPPAEALKYDPLILIKMRDLAIKIITEEFPQIKADQVGVAGHIDQASIHIHTVFDIPDNTTFSKMIADRKYSRFQQLWNEAIRDKFSNLPIETITPLSESDKIYIGLAEFKKKTLLEATETTLEDSKALLEAQDSINAQSSEIDALKGEIALLEDSVGELHQAIKNKATYSELEAIVEKQEPYIRNKPAYKSARERVEEVYKANIGRIKDIPVRTPIRRSGLEDAIKRLNLNNSNEPTQK